MFFVSEIEELEECHSTPQEDKRMSIPREFLKQHLINTFLMVEWRIPELVLNVDELGSSEWEERRPFKVFVKRETERKIIEHPVSRKISHMTLLACISCSGNSLTPLIITKKAINESFWDSGISKDKEIRLM